MSHNILISRKDVGISLHDLVVERADLLLILGCSLRQTLAKHAVKYFEGNRILLINEEEDESDHIADLVIHGKPRDVLPKLYG